MNGWDEERSLRRAGSEGQGASKGQDGNCYWGRTPPSCCAPPRRQPAGCCFSGPQWGNRGSGAKKIISGGEKNKLVGQPVKKITSGRIGVEK